MGYHGVDRQATATEEQTQRHFVFFERVRLVGHVQRAKLPPLQQKQQQQQQLNI